VTAPSEAQIAATEHEAATDHETYWNDVLLRFQCHACDWRTSSGPEAQIAATATASSRHWYAGYDGERGGTFCGCGASLTLDAGGPVPAGVPVGEWRFHQHLAAALLTSPHLAALFAERDAEQRREAIEEAAERCNFISNWSRDQLRAYAAETYPKETDRG